MTIAVVVGFLLIWVLALFSCQRRLIYFPRPYGQGDAFVRNDRMREIDYSTGAGRQVAFYVGPRDAGAGPPARLWVLLGGNAATALDWLDFVEQFPDARAAFLLIDYPGYGRCAGRPTRASIRESARAALRTALERLPSAAAGQPPLIGILGHSLGAAAGLELAVDAVPAVDRLVLVAPFTNMVDIARRSVGWPLCNLVLDRFDNRARLADLAARDPRPAVAILHGAADAIVPAGMGRALAASYPDWIQYIEIAGGDHNYILESAQARITDVMTAAP